MSEEEIEQLLSRIHGKIKQEIRKVKMNQVNGLPINNNKLGELKNDYENVVVCGSLFSNDPVAQGILNEIKNKYSD
jgi:hypothetical protein